MTGLIFLVRPMFRGLVAFFLALTGVAFSGKAQAQIGSERYSSIVVDAASGNVLAAANADEFRYPASLTKMMTIYMLFEAVRDRRISFNDPVPVSASAASMPPTKLGLLPGTYITVEQALLGLVTKSANDAAAALGEMMGGDEERFAQMMTLRARALGMTRTTFRNASGLPDWNQVTTARDLAILARHLIQDFPGYYHYFSTPYFQFHGRTVFNHQRLLQTYPGADGLKTGYIEASGYNVTTSAVRGEARLIGVVMGASNGGERDAHMTALLDQGFERMGVPMLLSRREMQPSFRLPPVIASAHAAMPRMPVQVAEARPYRGRAARYAPEPRYAEPRYAEPRMAEPRMPERVPVRRQPDLRGERVRTQPVYYMPPARVAAPSRPIAARAAPAPRGPQTRTAHNPGWARSRG